MANRPLSFLAAATIFAWFIVGATVVGLLIEGFVLSVLWGWFVVPTFGLAPLTVPVACGLAAIASLLRGGDKSEPHNPEKTDDPADGRRSLERARTALFGLLLRPALLLAVGWLIKEAM